MLATLIVPLLFVFALFLFALSAWPGMKHDTVFVRLGLALQVTAFLVDAVRRGPPL